ncbi:hypothetical protein CLV63_10769 [Murinocardiopsis flavida]|uniref:Uncharacterized protein n=1 Tax=Murinocardiopsis flavida TaxID=645275 RepID=A0A2P8DKJ2_9ACTN|nr:hypothetical protein CLV63_10769 [Murinocardiopsis flavida]
MLSAGGKPDGPVAAVRRYPAPRRSGAPAQGGGPGTRPADAGGNAGVRRRRQWVGVCYRAPQRRRGLPGAGLRWESAALPAAGAASSSDSYMGNGYPPRDGSETSP